MYSMLVLSAAEMQACDRATTERHGIPSLQLMRAASAAVAGLARRHFSRARRITVLCGRGNNGGDGMMTARLLSRAGCDVTTILLGAPEGLKGDAAEAWRELNEPAHGAIFVVNSAEELARHKDALNADLIVDAVLGTGFTPPMKGLALDALQWIKGSAAPVLAVDLPSGWPADAASATVDEPVFPADAVVTFTAPKPAHVFGQLTRRWDQPVVVAPIGSPEEAIVSTLGVRWAGAALKLVQEPRAAAANKGNFGHVLVVGGSIGRSGAPAMTGLGALRAGAGLVTVAAPAPVVPQVAAVAPELMTWLLEESLTGGIAVENAARDALAALTERKTVLAVGPGLGQRGETVEFVAALLRESKLPVVIDADGLNILSAERTMLAEVAGMAQGGRIVVMTPHPGEMARLADTSVAEIQADRLDAARGFARRNGVTLVLKGARTLVAHADGSVAVNTTGNPGMAKGGSGDLLTGLIAGLMAQHPGDAARAVEAAVYLHGLACDMAVRKADEHTLLATDCLRQLARAFRFRGAEFHAAEKGSSPKPLGFRRSDKDSPLESPDFQSDRKNGYVWLQGLPRGGRRGRAEGLRNV
ncbi:MAG TPA: NAD(P)H-hydrate dehydratase [Terracidiphilus sp.]|nr:NAD(P)H-hydrate dehydratase [Terracidiphilus sp.]